MLGLRNLSDVVTEERLRLYPPAILGAAAFAFLFTVGTSSGVWTVTGTLGGDYPAFYTGGRIVWDGRETQLYDWATQGEYQKGLHPDETNGFLPYVYPPFVALAYAPLAALPFVMSYVLHTLIVVAALGLSVYWMRPMLPRLNGRVVAAFTIALTFYPMAAAVLGSQNTAFTLLLVVGIWRGLHERKDSWAGVATGMLLYKPHFAVPLLGLLFLARRTRTLVTAACVGVFLYIVSAAVSGWAWPALWLEQIPKFHGMDQSVNRFNSVGTLGFFETLWGPGETSALVIGSALTVLWIAILMWVWWRQEGDLADRMGLAATGLVLIPPHLMFYDAGLLLIPLAVLAEKHGRRLFLPLIAIWSLSFMGAKGSAFGANPLFLLVVIVGVMVWMQRSTAAESFALGDHTADLPATCGIGERLE